LGRDCRRGPGILPVLGLAARAFPLAVARSARADDRQRSVRGRPSPARPGAGAQSMAASRPRAASAPGGGARGPRRLRGGAGTSRYSLAQIETVLVGRGTSRRAARSQQSRELRVEVPDAWLSSAHARLVRRDGQWWIVDALSTNGTRVNGRPCAEACLQDGD